MPKRLELSPHESTEELEHRYRKANDPVERSHLQMVWLLSEARTTQEANGLFEEIDQIEEALVERCIELLDLPEAIRDLTNVAPRRRELLRTPSTRSSTAENSPPRQLGE